MTLDIQAARARIEEATLGPWARVRENNKDLVVRPFDFFGAQREVVTGDIGEDDAEFIAAARTDLPAALEIIDALLSTARAVVEQYDGELLQDGQDEAGPHTSCLGDSCCDMCEVIEQLRMAVERSEAQGSQSQVLSEGESK